MKLPSTFYDHLSRFYAGLETASKPVPNGKGKRMFKGRVTHVYAAEGLPFSYYTRVMQMLTEMECIKQTHRGGGGHGKTEITLLAPPDPTTFARVAKRLGVD